ncbi:MAG: PAS domain-containing sensor histidine kinase [Leptospiraceae bacterium]|nr:PAS domain-containing sensor histidine kinase [Leptospiraceae bacterium]
MGDPKKIGEGDYFELQSIFDSIPDPIVLIDEKYTLVRVNYATLNFVGADKFSKILGKNCYSVLYNRDNICPFCPIYNSLKHLSNPTFLDLPQKDMHVQILQRVDNRNESLILSFFPSNRGDDSFSFVEKITNITKSREKEEENLRLRNLASLGIMVSGVAHELNNPLTGINLMIQSVLKELKENMTLTLREKFEFIESDLKKASSIVSDIISFAKPQKVSKSFSDITETIYKAKETVERLYPEACNNISWEINWEKETQFYFNPLRMERLFTNLFQNSIQAIDYKDGRIFIEIKKKKGKIQIIVEDNGGGIPQNIINKVFDPFFSNRKDGTGTGLGLSICFSIIKEHNGKLNVKSFENKTRFIISIPES